MHEITYGEAIQSAFDYLLQNYPEVVVIGQGVRSPWYVGNSMTDLDKKFGADRIIDTPVSEAACTGAAVGASLVGLKTIVVHPRMDFMLYAMDAIVNQAAKWSHMFGGQAHANVTFRGIINRGGEQGAQHSQSLHAWFAHIPGLRVVMPATVVDARDLLIASVLCKDPVLYIDDRWLYDQKSDVLDINIIDLTHEGPRCINYGDDITIVSNSYSTQLAISAAKELVSMGISTEIIDLRVVNPLNLDIIVKSVKKTGRILAIDGGWRSCGLSAEIIARLLEILPLKFMRSRPRRLTLPDAPAPCSRVLEKDYYFTKETIIELVVGILGE